jgi:hypothetical protein
MRLRNVIGATLAFTYIFYTLSDHAPRSVRRDRTKRTAQPTIAKAASPVPKRALRQATSAVPAQRKEIEDDRWFDSTAEFRAALAERLHALAPDKAAQLLRRYKSEYDLHDAKIASILKEQDSSYYYDHAKEKVVFKDKKRYKQLNEKIFAMERDYSLKVEEIFADLYPAMLEVKAEFEEEMQVYNRHEQRVGISL